MKDNVSQDSKPSISQKPINILFNPSSIAKKDVWEIDIVQILELLHKILEQTGKKDLRIAGMAALSSSMIHRMKVESIFALQKAAIVLLENLIGTIANPRSRKGTQMNFEPVETPDLKDYFISLENIIGKYEDMIINKIRRTGIGNLGEIVSGLDPIDAIRCFFAILFLARDEKVELEQIEDDIQISLIVNKN